MKFSTFAVNNIDIKTDANFKITAFSFNHKSGYNVTYADATYDIEPTYLFADANLQEMLDDNIIECHTTNTALIFTAHDPAHVLECYKDLKECFDDFKQRYKVTQINSHTFVLS